MARALESLNVEFSKSFCPSPSLALQNLPQLLNIKMDSSAKNSPPRMLGFFFRWTAFYLHLGFSNASTGATDNTATT